MIERRAGDILEADAEALVNPVNCVGVMGRGLALQFRNAFTRARQRGGLVLAGRTRHRSAGVAGDARSSAPAAAARGCRVAFSGALAVAREFGRRGNLTFAYFLRLLHDRIRRKSSSDSKSC